MARKKKNTELKPDQVKLKETPTAYQGTVTISIMKGNNIINKRMIKNTGTLNLFRSIAGFLNYEFLGTSNEYMLRNLPQYLGVGDQTNPTKPTVTDTQLQSELDLGNRIRLNRHAIIRNDTNYALIYSATIPYSTILRRTLTEFGLFNDITPSSGTMYARITAPEGVTMTSGTNLLLEWTLTIQNK